MTDIIGDISSIKLDLPEHSRRIETRRSGPFTFQIGVDSAAIMALYQRVIDAYKRFASSPLSQVANKLEKEVVASSIFGTNSIEGGTLTEQETQLALELDPETVQEEEKRRAVNLKVAYGLASKACQAANWRLSLSFVSDIHAAITDKLTHPHNRPGLWRDNPDGLNTYVGDETHGGRYKPPAHGHDVRVLMTTLIEWHAELEDIEIPALIRAPLVHYYYELIHPFWDGNGRVGRVLEATILQAAGFRYAPFVLARFYFDHIDRYFALFNTCRKASLKGTCFPNTPFIQFHLSGMLSSINRLNDRVNFLASFLIFESHVNQLLANKEINARQYVILSQLLSRGDALPLSDLRKSPWYKNLYLKRTEKTKQRDLKKLREMELIRIDAQQRIWAGFIEPPQA